MENNVENKRNEEVIIKRYFIISGIILVLFILLGIVDIEIIIERAIRIFSF
jgi:hypothetical protein